MADKKTRKNRNLRGALIDAGQELLREGGIDALTLRQCAIRAGVSHAAPAHHFDGLISLKMAIVARGYQIFSQHMLDAKSAAAADPYAQLLAICHGYLDFANAHRAMFNLIFTPRGPEFPKIDEVTLQEFAYESHNSYQILSDACTPFLGADVTETAVWALVHGYAMLFANLPTKKMGKEIPAFDAVFAQLTLQESKPSQN